RGDIPASVSGADDFWVDAPGASALYSAGTILEGNSAAIPWRVAVVVRIAILHPFHDIAEHVVKPKRVGFERSYGCRFVVAILAIHDVCISAKSSQCLICYVLVRTSIV